MRFPCMPSDFEKQGLWSGKPVHWIGSTMRSHGSGAGCYCDCGPADAAHAADGAHAADAAYETDGAYAAYETDGADAAYETDGAYAADAAHETDGAYATDAAHGTDETHGTYEAHAFCSAARHAFDSSQEPRIGPAAV